MCTNCGDPGCPGPGHTREVGGMRAETVTHRHRTDPTKVKVTITMTFPGVTKESELVESTIIASACHTLNAQMRVKGMSVALNGVVYGKEAFDLAKRLGLPGAEINDDPDQHTLKESVDGGPFKTLTAVDQVEESEPPAAGGVQDEYADREKLNRMFQKVFGARPQQRSKRRPPQEEM